MIDIVTNLPYQNQTITLWGKISEIENSIELNCLLENTTIEKFCENIIYSQPSSFLVIDTKAKSYVVYDCKFNKSTISFSNSSIITLIGQFSRLTRENEINKKYNCAIWTFQYIEKFFPLESFNTKFKTNGNGFKFEMNQNIIHKFELIGGIKGEIRSDYSGIVQSTSLYNLSVVQQKVIQLSFPEKVSQARIDEVIIKIKKYFEFIAKQELQIKNIVYIDKNSQNVYSGYLISAPILKTKTMIQKIKDNPYRKDINSLFIGLKKWVELYDYYIPVIEIWQKTIYNLNVSQMDTCMWFCQAFELLCQLNDSIYKESMKLKAISQQFPNLKNYLDATNNLYHIWDGVSSKHFKDVKDVRDKITHNNPGKIVTETQKENARQLIELFFIKTVECILDINGIPLSAMLKPE